MRPFPELIELVEGVDEQALADLSTLWEEPVGRIIDAIDAAKMLGGVAPVPGLRNTGRKRPPDEIEMAPLDSVTTQLPAGPDYPMVPRELLAAAWEQGYQKRAASQGLEPDLNPYLDVP